MPLKMKLRLRSQSLVADSSFPCLQRPPLQRHLIFKKSKNRFSQTYQIMYTVYIYVYVYIIPNQTYQICIYQFIVKPYFSRVLTDSKKTDAKKRPIWVNYNISLTWIVRPFSDASPQSNHDPRVRENSEVVMKFTQIYHLLTIDSPLLSIINPYYP